LMTLRNEDPARAFRRLRTVKDSVDATGYGERYSYFILSDTNEPEAAAAEEEALAAWRSEVRDPERIVYRRRSENTGFKAGNLRDFCETFGRDFDLMLPLDADSLMAGDAIVRLVRVMQAHPRLGILQSLVVGAPNSVRTRESRGRPPVPRFPAYVRLLLPQALASSQGYIMCV